MLENEGLFNFIEGKFVVDNLIIVLLGLEKLWVVFRLHSVVCGHHSCPAGHEFHFLHSFWVLQNEPIYSTETVNEQERPTHRTDIGGVESTHLNTLLQHILKFVAEREGHLSGDKTLEN